MCILRTLQKVKMAIKKETEDKGGKANLFLVRDTFNEVCTLGKLYLNGEFMAHTLELPWINNKRSISCIPKGVYDCRLRLAQGSVSRDYLHLLVKEVPGRSWILFHIGNTSKDTKGCILTGLLRKDNKIIYSTDAHTQLMDKITSENLSQQIELIIKNR